jgi:cyclopropane-fatty-acyl-phospholipid synthase
MSGNIKEVQEGKHDNRHRNQHRNKSCGFWLNIGSILVERVGSFLFKTPSWGALSVTFPNGNVSTIGDINSKNHAYLKLNNLKLISKIKRRGTVGFASAYMNGDIDSKDLTALFTFFLKNRNLFDKAGKGMIRRAASDIAYHSSRANTRKRAKENISEHYDLGNDFYALWLDKTMTYSSAIFSASNQTLEQAQKAKYHHIAKMAGVKKAATILEIGSGWGGFAQIVASDYEANLYGISLSKEQIKYAQDRIKKLDLQNRATFHFEDYRDSKGLFDHIISIEMIEAVGEENWESYFASINRLLKPNGTALIQAITIDENDFLHYRKNPDFIQRYIFPGGMLLTKKAMKEQGEKANLKLEEVELFGKSYARTLRLWHKSFLSQWEVIKELGFDEKFKRKWIYYLSYCEAGFEDGVIDVGIYSYLK